MSLADIMKRSVFAVLVACAAVTGARASDEFRVEIRDDASATLVDSSGRTICELRLEISSADGKRAKVLRGRGQRKARVVVGRTTLHLEVVVREAGGGVIIDLRAAATAQAGRSAWTVPTPLKARVVVRLPSGIIGDGSATVCGKEVVLGPDELFGPDALARARRGRAKSVHTTAEGRTVWFAPEALTRFCVQSELPGSIELEQLVDDDGDKDEIVLRLGATDANTACRLAYAVYVGRRQYTGRPVFLEEPKVKYLPDLRCFETALRVFGDWRNPFDPEDVAVEAAWRAAPRSGRVAGFFAQSIEAKISKSDDDTTTETLAAVGWPSFRARLPGSAGGGDVTITFATKGGRADIRARVLANRLPFRPAIRTPPHTVAGATLDTSAWRTSDDAANALRDLHAARLGIARMPFHTGAWALEGERAGSPDLEAAWRLDRVFEQAARRGVRLVPVLGRGRALEKFAKSSPYFTGDTPLARSAREFFEGRESRAAFRRTIRYAAARWGSVESLKGWEIFDGADLLADKASAASLAPWLRSMAEWLRVHDSKHPASATLRAGAWAEPIKAARVTVGRALALASNGTSAGKAFELARDAASCGDFLVLESADPKTPPSHVALWAAAAAGGGKGVFLGPGTPTSGAAAVLRFLADGGDVGELPSLLSFEEEGYRLLGRRGPSGAAWWLARASADDRQPGEDAEDDEPEGVRFLPVSRGVEFEITGLAPGRYAVEWWQTHEGRLLTRSEMRAPHGTVVLRAPPFASDIAGRLVKLDGKSPSLLRN
jgi:hypothetical protein